MAMDHKGPILGIDISPTVIKEMNEKHKEKCKEHANMYLFHQLYHLKGTCGISCDGCC